MHPKTQLEGRTPYVISVLCFSGEDAIQDAKENAKLNNLDNIQYHCGKAEEILPLLGKTILY